MRFEDEMELLWYRDETGYYFIPELMAVDAMEVALSHAIL